MTIDVNTITAVKNELCGTITGYRIEKVQQPQRDVIILTLRDVSGGTRRLLISAASGDMRVHLTQHAFENPAAPPMFCMLLRKHLTGARVEAVTQPPGERMLELELKTSSAMGEISAKRLVIELFGRIPNIILLDGSSVVIDCLRRVSGSFDTDSTPGRRMILPGLRYTRPAPPQERQRAGAAELTPGGTAGGSISKKLDDAFTRMAKERETGQRTSELSRIIKTAQKRIRRKLEIQRNELEETGQREYIRQCADIIMANLGRIGKGDEVLIADDFYANDGQGGAVREIRLDPLLTPQKNAAKYYKDYAKARNAVAHLTGQIANGEKELDYLDSVMGMLGRADNEQVISEIRGELTQTGYIKAKAESRNKQKKLKNRESRPLTYSSSDGLQILAGRSNTQNDNLTFKTAAKSDIWLHTQKIHGAHVIIRLNNQNADETTLKEAASIAAYHSAARGGGTVPVDYTFVKNVKKPSGARPGMVIYTDYKTLMAKADEELVEKLRI